MRFEFATAARIVFGPGTVREVPAAAAEMGRRPLVVTRRSTDLSCLGIAGETFPIHFPIDGEPTVELLRQGAERAREADCDMVIALGGGSAIDAGKAIAALLANGGDPLDYLEVVGQGKPLSRPKDAGAILLPLCFAVLARFPYRSHGRCGWGFPEGYPRGSRGLDRSGAVCAIEKFSLPLGTARAAIA